MKVNEFLKSLTANDGELLKTMFISLLISFSTLSIFYFFKLQSVPDIIPKYGFSLFFAILSYALIFPSLKKVKSYSELPCMTGMMIGMTIGFIAGFLLGFSTGTTNGMFWGSIFGMSIGIIFGVWCGSCCGIMGVMEGMIAGFMGGLMGAMTAVMSLYDHLIAMGIIVFILCGFIMFGLNYLIYTETKTIKRRPHTNHKMTIILSIALTIITIWFMIFGPRSVNLL